MGNRRDPRRRSKRRVKHFDKTESSRRSSNKRASQRGMHRRHNAQEAVREALHLADPMERSFRGKLLKHRDVRNFTTAFSAPGAQKWTTADIDRTLGEIGSAWSFQPTCHRAADCQQGQ